MNNNMPINQYANRLRYKKCTAWHIGILAHYLIIIYYFAVKVVFFV